ncbi:MAG TPA: hypothetical protein VLB69_13365 [Rudaea sp.]|nr:hypothetical protein [Rudaea sp.]
MTRPSVAAILLACAGAAHADAVLEYQGGDDACHADFTRVAVQGLSLRVDSPPPSQDMSMVYDAAEKVGVALDHKRKQFFEMEFDDDAIDFQGDVMKSTSNMVDRKAQQVQAMQPHGDCTAARDETPCPAAGGAAGMAGMPQVDPKMIEQVMQQNMQHMTPGQRAQMEAAMKNLRASGYGGFGAPPSEPVVEATGETRDVGGLACAVERVTLDGALQREDCRAALDAIGLDAADVRRMQRAIARMQKFSNALRDNLHVVGMPAVRRRDQPDTQHLLVERRCYEQGKPIGDVTLRVRRESAPADWFVTPPDYARMDMGMRGH